MGRQKKAKGPRAVAECVGGPRGSFTDIPRRGADVWYGGLDAVERIFRNCRYPDNPTFRNLFDLYSLSPVAGRMVETFPNYTWDTVPTITDRGSTKRRSPFESAWLDFSENVFGGNPRGGLRIDTAGERPVFGENGLFHSLDVLAGIGGEAMLLIGFDDGLGLDKPLALRKGMTVSYHKVLHGGQYRVAAYNEDEGSVHYGRPEVYVTTPWKYGRDINESRAIPAGIEIHRDRCVVFKETRGLDYGVSRIKKSFNTILDIMKISGASAEVYWLAAYAGVKVETDPDARLDEDDRERMKREVEKYSEGLSRSLLLTGAKGELMYPAIVSPRDHFDMQMKLLSLDSGIPQRFLIGSEAAKLASQQDTDNWNDRVNTRRMTVAVPQAVLPYIGRLVAGGVLPAPAEGCVKVAWTDKTTTPLRDRMLTGRDAANAFAVYTASCGHKAMGFVDFLHHVLQFPRELAMELGEAYDAKFFEERAAQLASSRPPQAGEDEGGVRK